MDRKEYMRNWRAKKAEHLRQYERARYATNPIAKLNRAHKTEEIKAKRRAFYLANKDRLKAISKQNKIENPERYREYSKNSYLRERERLAGRVKASICEVCGSGNNKIVYDHDHSTGKFRGWICQNCNTALGHVKDKTEVLEKLIKYLNTSRGSPPPALVELIKSPIQLKQTN